MCNFLPVKTKKIDTDENEIVETMNSFLFNSKHIEVKPCGVCFEKFEVLKSSENRVFEIDTFFPSYPIFIAPRNAPHSLGINFFP